jgi:hypothetical protein
MNKVYSMTSHAALLPGTQAENIHLLNATLPPG